MPFSSLFIMSGEAARFTIMKEAGERRQFSAQQPILLDSLLIGGSFY